MTTRQMSRVILFAFFFALFVVALLALVFPNEARGFWTGVLLMCIAAALSAGVVFALSKLPKITLNDQSGRNKKGETR